MNTHRGREGSGGDRTAGTASTAGTAVAPHCVNHVNRTTTTQHDTHHCPPLSRITRVRRFTHLIANRTTTVGINEPTSIIARRRRYSRSPLATGKACYSINTHSDSDSTRHESGGGARRPTPLLRPLLPAARPAPDTTSPRTRPHPPTGHGPCGPAPTRTPRPSPGPSPHGQPPPAPSHP
jgi:hypothetical protein